MWTQVEFTPGAELLLPWNERMWQNKKKRNTEKAKHNHIACDMNCREVKLFTVEKEDGVVRSTLQHVTKCFSWRRKIAVMMVVVVVVKMMNTCNHHGDVRKLIYPGNNSEIPLFRAGHVACPLLCPARQFYYLAPSSPTIQYITLQYNTILVQYNSITRRPRPLPPTLQYNKIQSPPTIQSPVQQKLLTTTQHTSVQPTITTRTP